MSKLYFFKKRETKRTILQKNSTQWVLRSVLLISFWLLSIGIVRSQTAPNISYTTPQTYLLNAGITNLSPTNSGGTVPALTYKEVSTFAGTTSGFLDGTGTTAKMDGPLGMTLDANGDVYFIDSVNHRIRKMTTVDNVTTVTTIAGDGYSFLFFGRLRNNASGSLASFNYPADLALDTANNCLYVTDKENDVIRKVSLTAPYPVTTFAGSGTSTSTDNTGVLATFKKPSGIAIDPTGTYLYVTDRGGNKIRRITISTAQVTTIAGSGTAGTADNATGTAATFNDPTGIAVDADYIYITDFGGHKIRKISKTSPYTVSTIAGSGTKSSVDHATGTSATFDNPYGMTLDGAGNLLVAESGNKIRKITPAGVVTTIAGSGVASSLNANGTSATFDSPSNIVINPATGIGYVSEYTGDRIRKIELGGYTISPTLPLGLSFDVTTGVISGNPTAINNGPSNYTITAYNYYGTSETTVAITTANLPTIATTAVTLITGTTATSGGSGIATNGSDLLEKGVCWSTSANPTILDSKLIEGATAATSFTSSLTGLATSTTYYIRAYATNSVGTGYGNEVSFTTSVAPPNISYPTNIDAQVGSAISTFSGTNTGGIVSSSGGVVSTFAGSTRGNIDGTGSSAQFNRPYKITSDNLNNLFVVDILNNNIRKITPNGVVTTYFIPNGITPMGIVCDASGNLYVTSPQHHRIYKITSAGAMSVFAGSGVLGLRDGLSSEAMFSYPWGLTMDATGTIFVTEVGNHCIRRIDPDGVVSLVAGNGSVGSNDGIYGVLSSFSNPRGITCDAFGNLFVADSNNHRIRKITSSGSVSTIAGGSSTSGNTDGLGTAAKFYGPSDLCIDNKGNLFVADVFNHKIRKITPNGLVSTVAGSLFGYEDGSISVARFNNPASLTLDSQGNILIADDNNSKIRKITFDGYTISPSLPAGLVLNPDGNITGTPTVASPPTDYVITATNAGGSSSTTISIAVTAALGVAQDTYSKALVAYPNPFTDSFNIDVATNSSDAITVAIYDMSGKKLETHKGTPTEISALHYGNNYTSGVYNVVVTQGTEVKTLRMIKK